MNQEFFFFCVCSDLTLGQFEQICIIPRFLYMPGNSDLGYLRGTHNAPLKFAILSHCQEWQNKFTTLLREIATTKLQGLHQFLQEMGEK